MALPLFFGTYSHPCFLPVIVNIQDDSRGKTFEINISTTLIVLLDSSHQEQQTPFLSTSTLSQIFLNVLCTNCVSILYSIQVYKNVLSFHKPHILKYLAMIPRSAPHPQTPQVAFFILTLK